jgi:hypothetical protein
MHDVPTETIAGRLTEAQRRAITHVGAGNGWGLCAGVRWDRRTRYRLFDLGLVAASRLTDKGRAVLANLKARER